MSERTHMTAPDGRRFTFPQWVEYLKQHPDSVDEAYKTESGEVFEIDGFRFNVHGVCRNPHVITVKPENGVAKANHCYYLLRTFRKWISMKDRRVVWWVDSFSINSGAHCYGHLSPEDPDIEEDAILTGFRKIRESQLTQIAWYQRAIEGEAVNDITDTGYRTSLACVRAMLKLTEDEIESRMQLSLF